MNSCQLLADLRSCSKRTCAISPRVLHTAGDQQEGFESHALLVGMRPVGALAWRPANLSREVATAVCAQIGIALTRAMAIEASAHLEASRESDRLRTALIDSLTHELRTPLTAIRAAPPRSPRIKDSTIRCAKNSPRWWMRSQRVSTH